MNASPQVSRVVSWLVDGDDLGVIPTGELIKGAVLEFHRHNMAESWLPDDVVFLEKIPTTNLGKYAKNEVRARPEDFKPRTLFVARTRRA